jgi:dipeptidase D
MVGEKNEGTAHDFTRDPLRLLRDGDVLKADGTTLGADNGIGVAAALAALEDQSVAHGPLEVLLTVDEETGLTGANAVRSGWLRGSILLNLDSETENVLTIGCAGGIDTIAKRPLRRLATAADRRPYRIKVSGLRGGHSGVDINRGRGNAIQILARALLSAWLPADDPRSMDLLSFDGGGRRNAIPREAFALVVLGPEQEPALRTHLGRLRDELRAELGAGDPGVDIALELSLDPWSSESGPIHADDALVLLRLLAGMPNGVLELSPDVAGAVQTSSNLAIVQTSVDAATVILNQRSSIDSARLAAAARVSGLCALAGFRVEHDNAYPGWRPDPDSMLVRRMVEVARGLSGKEPVLEIIHAGLECGVIGSRYPGLQMVSFGPNMWAAHCPDESVNIPSVNAFWQLLVATLTAL